MKKNLILLLTACSLVSADAAVFEYTVTLDGPTEPTASLGTGTGSAVYNDADHSLKLDVSFTGLTGNTTVSHIHAATAAPFGGTAGVASTTPTFAGFPAGVKSGTYSAILDLTAATSFNPAYVTANGGTPASAEAALTSAIAAGKAYWNIHSSEFGGGEIRGFFVPVPEPSSVGLLWLGALGLAARCWGKRRI